MLIVVTSYSGFSRNLPSIMASILGIKGGKATMAKSVGIRNLYKSDHSLEAILELLLVTIKLISSNFSLYHLILITVSDNGIFIFIVVSHLILQQMTFIFGFIYFQ